MNVGTAPCVSHCVSLCAFRRATFLRYDLCMLIGSYMYPVQAFPQCTACSPVVVAAHRDGGFGFLRRCFDEAGFLESTTGLDKMLAAVDMEAFELEDSDSDALSGMD